MEVNDRSRNIIERLEIWLLDLESRFCLDYMTDDSPSSIHPFHMLDFTNPNADAMQSVNLVHNAIPRRRLCYICN